MEEISKAIQGASAAIASIAIAASVAYETGYFSIVGKKYQGVLSVADYLSSALEWLPWLCLLYALGFVLARLAYARSTRINIGRRVRIAFAVVLASVLCGLIVIVPFYQVLLYMPLALMPIIAAPLFVHSPVPGSVKKLTALSMSAVTAVLALYCSGIGQAHRDILIIDNAYIVRSGTDPEGAQVLRTLQKGLLVWRPQDSKAELISWDKIQRMTHLIWKSYDAPWFEPLGCKVLNILCHNQPPPSP
jgi:hypothetical protein